MHFFKTFIELSEIMIGHYPCLEKINLSFKSDMYQGHLTIKKIIQNLNKQLNTLRFLGASQLQSKSKSSL